MPKRKRVIGHDEAVTVNKFKKPGEDVDNGNVVEEEKAEVWWFDDEVEEEDDEVEIVAVNGKWTHRRHLAHPYNRPGSYVPNPAYLQ